MSEKKRIGYGINSVVLAPCFVGKDAELGYTAGGAPYAKFSVGYNGSYGSKDGDVVEATYWFNCVMWGPQAEALAKFITKGKQLDITGKLTQRTYEGKSFVEIVIGGNSSGINFRASGGKKGAATSDDNDDTDSDAEEAPKPKSVAKKTNDIVPDDSDEQEVPF
jgi:single-strand DNA-binding protein